MPSDKGVEAATTASGLLDVIDFRCHSSGDGIHCFVACVSHCMLVHPSRRCSGVYKRSADGNFRTVMEAAVAAGVNYSVKLVDAELCSRIICMTVALTPSVVFIVLLTFPFVTVVSLNLITMAPSASLTFSGDPS